MGHTGADEIRAMPQARQRLAELQAHLPEGVADQVLELAALDQAPEPLGGVQVRRVAGQPLEVEALRAARAQESLDRLAVVDRGAVPHDQQLPRQMLEEMA